MFKTGGNKLSHDILIRLRRIQETLHPIRWIEPGLSGIRLKAGMELWAESDSPNLNSYRKVYVLSWPRPNGYAILYLPLKKR